MNEFQHPASFFSGDNVTVMVCLALVGFVILTIIVLVHKLDRGKDNALTIAQIEADAKVKAVQIEADADIRVAELEAHADITRAQLESGSPLETAAGAE